MASLSSKGKPRVRTPRRGLNAPEFDFNAAWGVLEQAFIAIHSKNASSLSFEELYRLAYKTVLAKKGEELYNNVAQFEENWLGTQVRSKISAVISAPLLLTNADGAAIGTAEERKSSGSAFLRALKQAWEDHQLCMGMLTDVLMYMDRVFCTDHRKSPIYTKAMGLFRDQILLSPAQPSQPAIIHILNRVILDQIQMVRDGEQIDSHLVKANVYMLEGLYVSDQEVEEEKIYLQSFEPCFLDTSVVFYREEAERLLKDSDAGTYCRHAKKRINEENDRCRSTLSESTAAKIQKVVEDELIRRNLKRLIAMDTGVKYMVENDRLDELGLVFELEARVDPRKTELTEAMRGIIADMGTAINNAATAAALAPAQPATTTEDGAEDKAKAGPARQVNQQTVAALKWVQDILALKAQIDNIWKVSFESDQQISTTLTRGITDVINAFNRCSEYISLFIDENMKKGIKDKTEVEIDHTLEQAITTLRYLQDKDMFETYYKKHLGKRLLLKKSQSIDVEKQMISRMKLELGNSFTMKLEAMFKDMALSEELTSGYRAYVSRLGSADPKRIDLGINVLTAMTWPLESYRGGPESEGDTRTKVVFPSSLARVKTGFERFYSDKHSGRKLSWLTNMGEADIKATFANAKGDRTRTYDISCSTYAMLILLLFNDIPADQSLSYEEIQAQTNIPENDLKRNLQALAVAPKTRFLVKQPMSREINSGDKFHINDAFSSKFIRIKIGVVSSGNKVEGESDRKETEKKANDSRGFVIDAAIVRIMKQRKLLAHAQLLTETITQISTQFKPDVNMIKKKIESLIEREYLERVDDAPVPSYRYLA